METLKRPTNIELEMIFLADAIFGDRARIDELGEIVKPEHFSNGLHGQLWEAAVRCARHGWAITDEGLVRLISEVGSAGEGTAREYLAELARHLSHGNPIHYVRGLHDLYLRRELMDAAADIMADAAVDDPERSGLGRLEAAEMRLFNLAEHGGNRPEGVTMAQARAAADALNEKARQAEDGISGVPTGLCDLDRRLGGLQAGELVVVAGRPGMGKTAMALTIARNAAAKGRKVRLVSLEMSSEQLLQRFYSQDTGISPQEQRKPLTAEQQRSMDAAGKRIDLLPIIIDDADAQTVAQIRARARRQKRRGGLDLLIVDYLGLLSPVDPKAQKVHQIEEMTKALKRLSKELSIPVVLLAQLNRGVENRDDKRPNLSDLRDSGAIEQDADVVMFLYREEYYLQKQTPEPDEYDDWARRLEAVAGVAEVIVAKFRQGEVGTAKVEFDGARQRFFNLDRWAPR